MRLIMMRLVLPPPRRNVNENWRWSVNLRGDREMLGDAPLPLPLILRVGGLISCVTTKDSNVVARGDRRTDALATFHDLLEVAPFSLSLL